MGFWFAEQFGEFDSEGRLVRADYATVRANIERYLKAGRARSAVKAEALQMLIIQPNGKPQRGEPARIASTLNRRLQRGELSAGTRRLAVVNPKTVARWIEKDFQRKVDYLIKQGRVSRAQAWGLIKTQSSWAAVELGIRRSIAGREAGSVIPRRRSGW